VRLLEDWEFPLSPVLLPLTVLSRILFLLPCHVGTFDQSFLISRKVSFPDSSRFFPRSPDALTEAHPHPQGLLLSQGSSPHGFGDRTTLTGREQSPRARRYVTPRILVSPLPPDLFKQTWSIPRVFSFSITPSEITP